MLSSEVQLSVYSTSRSLEARALAIDHGIRRLKQCCLDGGDLAIGQLVSLLSELRWQLRQANELSGKMAASLGMKSAEEGKAAAPTPRADAEEVIEASEVPGIRGTTDVLPVPDLVSILSNLQKTGTLTLQSTESMFVFEFQQGRIVHAITNLQAPELRLGTILEAQNKLTSEQLQEHITASAEANELLGAHLVRTAVVSDTDLRAALDTQVRRIFDEAFGLTCARFLFTEGNLTRVAQRAVVNTMELLLEAARTRDQHILDNDGGGLDRETKGLLNSVLGG